MQEYLNRSFVGLIISYVGLSTKTYIGVSKSYATFLVKVKAKYQKTLLVGYVYRPLNTTQEYYNIMLDSMEL